MLISAVSFLVVAQSSSEIPEGLMNNPVFHYQRLGRPADLICRITDTRKQRVLINYE